MKIGKALLYLRAGSTEQAERCNCLDPQEKTLREYCEADGIEIVAIYKDICSARNFDRPAFSELLQFLEENPGTINLILFTSWDRFSRNVDLAIRMIQTLNDFGVEVKAIQKPSEGLVKLGLLQK